MKTIIALFVSALLFTTVSFALDLEDARNKKIVIEQPDGFLKAADPTAKSFVDDINTKRRAAYADIAKKEGIDIKIVGEKAAQKIKEKMGK